VRLYRELADLFPGTREEVTSRVSLGRLLLDRMGNPGRALQLFESYLSAAPDGTLAEEARLGRALCLGRLGRSDEERGAWEDLLASHPDTVHQARARARLEELDTGRDR
jgi:TolA-binding protein